MKRKVAFVGLIIIVFLTGVLFKNLSYASTKNLDLLKAQYPDYEVIEIKVKEDEEPDENTTSNEIGNETTNETENETSNETGNETTNETGNETSNETGNETTNETGNETSNETGNETTNETGNETTNETSNETSNETTNETTNTVVNPTTEEPEEIYYDITDKVRAACNGASSTHKILIHIPSGTYYINNLVINNSYLAIVAEDDTILISDTSVERMIRIADSSNIMIYGGTWNANYKAQNGIEITNVKNLSIEKVNIQNTNKHGVALYNQSNANIKNIKVKNVNEYGVYIQNSTSSIENSEILYSNSSGIGASNSKNLRIENVTIQNSAKYGMVFYSESNANIKNVKVNKNKDYGIYNQNSTLTIQNSEITYNNCSGIAGTGSKTKLYIKNNKINNNGQNPRKTAAGELGHGVAIQEGTYGEINNNIINNNRVCGISVTTGNAKAIISNNQIFKNGRHGIGARDLTNMTITGNNIYSNSYNGIMLTDRSVANLTKNYLRYNARFGMSIGLKSTVTSTENNISYNTDSNITVNDVSSVLNITNKNIISYSKNNNGINVTGSATLNITGKNNTICNNAHHGISIISKDGKVNLKGKDNTIKNNKGAGIYAEKSQNIKLTGATTICNNNTSGIIIYGAKVTAKNLILKKNAQFGIAVRSKGNLTISKCTVQNNKAYGIHVVDKGTKAKIESNTITGNKNAGINIDKKAKVSNISNNTLKKNGDKAIRVNSAEVTKIDKNKIKKHGKYGIYMKKSKVKTIKGNKFYDIKKKNQIYKA